jgi:hypothetical protein
MKLKDALGLGSTDGRTLPVKVWLPSAVLLALVSALVLLAVGVPGTGAVVAGAAIGLLLAVPVATLLTSRRRPGR